MLLARRNLFQEKTRSVLCVSGVALAVMLVLRKLSGDKKQPRHSFSPIGHR